MSERNGSTRAGLYVLPLHGVCHFQPWYAVILNGIVCYPLFCTACEKSPFLILCMVVFDFKGFSFARRKPFLRQHRRQHRRLYRQLQEHPRVMFLPGKPLRGPLALNMSSTQPTFFQLPRPIFPRVLSNALKRSSVTDSSVS